MTETPILEVQSLQKTFRIGFFRKRVEAVRGVDFSVHAGEVFGLLGPNGAGKTTTIKMILRLIFPDHGSIRVFGLETRDRRAMQRVGYLPENPYVYRYLRVREFLDLCGRLTGLERELRRRRTEELIEKVGLGHATDRPIGRFSKGMMQRVGLAQALLHDPELLILDEPMSGLDPIGRKEVRELLLEQREQGKTLLFTSHILADVERLCDRVVILRSGRVTARGTLDELLEGNAKRVEIEIDKVSEELARILEGRAPANEETGHPVVRVDRERGRAVVIAESDAAVQTTVETALSKGAAIAAVVPQRGSLENLFVSKG